MARNGGKLKQLLGRLKVKKVKTWILILALIPLGFIDATLLRLDHIRMTELRDAVISADESGDEAALAQALNELKDYAFSNIVINIIEENGGQKIRFGTGPFYLEQSYLRDATAALAAAEEALSSDSNPYGNIYGMAGEVCRAEALKNGWTWDNVNFINCMMSEIAKYPSSDEIQDTIVAKLPSTELYRREFASPLWAPTLTGFFLLITLIIIVVIFMRFVVWVILRLSLLFI